MNPPMPARIPLLAGLLGLALAGPAYAADPIMPLDQVQRGMQCEGRSVFRGTTIETFNVEILDVLQQDPNGVGPAILFRAYGPAVDETGLGPGFSGSPIYCPDSDGVMRNAGAVASGVEDYGNDTALATPIESVLSLPVQAPPQARPATSAERRAHRWATPLFVSGAGPGVRQALLAAATREQLPLIAAPATSAQVSTGTDLQPGSAVAASISSGAIGLGAIGTVVYRDDASRVWAFGHPLDGAGERSIFLQGAFVHQVIGNPNPPGVNLGTYKLASPAATSSTCTSNELIVVPWITEYAVQRMPACTCDRGIVGSPANAGAAGTRRAATAATSVRMRMKSPA